MGWIKHVMGWDASKPFKKTASQSRKPEMPFGFTVGCHVSIKAALKLQLEGETDIVVPDDTQIMAIGTLDIGSNCRLVRCHLDNEHYFVQFLMNGPRASDIESLILFGYHEVRTLNSPDERARLMGPGSKIGMPYYELEHVEYVRQWGTEDGQTEMAALTENVITAEQSYAIGHRCVLYARHLNLAYRREFLLLSFETDEPGNQSLTTAVGVTLQLSDISISH